MPHKSLQALVDHLYQATAGAVAGTDRELVRHFARTGDHAAFAELVARHGSLVMSVSRRLLGNTPDAEDVCQATFMVLARKATAYGWKASVAGWLHLVACRLAQRVKRAASRRRQREREAAAMRAKAEPPRDISELAAVLDGELSKLPARYRDCLVLCYLQGVTRDQASRQLNVSLRTLDRRLSGGRELLRGRLVRRGISLSAALAAISVVSGEATAALSEACGREIVGHALAFASGKMPAAGAAAFALAQSALRWTLAAKLCASAIVLLAAAMVATGWMQTRESPSLPVIKTVLAQAASPVTEPPMAAPATEPVEPAANNKPLPSGAVAVLGTPRLPGLDDAGAIAVSPDGETIACGSLVSTQSIRLWDAKTGNERRRFDLFDGFAPLQSGVKAVAISPDGRFLLGAGSWSRGTRFGRIALWDIATGDMLWKAEARGAEMSSVAFSADGQMIASGCQDGTISLWDTLTGKEIRRLTGQPSIAALAFVSRGNSLVSAGGDEREPIRFWDVATGKEIGSVHHGGFISAMAISPDGRLLASGGSILRVVRIADGRELYRVPGHTEAISGIAFSSDGKVVATAGQDGRLWFWDAQSGAQIRKIVCPGGCFRSVVFLPGSTVCVAGSANGSVGLWDALTGKDLSPARGPRGTVCSLCYSPDGTLIAAGYQDGGVRVWNPTGKGAPRRLVEGLDCVTVIAFSPDGKTLAVADYERHLSLHDARSGRLLRDFKGVSGNILSVAFSPDGKHLVSGGDDNRVRLWDVISGDVVRDLPVIGSVAWSPDGRFIAAWLRSPAGAAHAAILDAATGQQLHDLQGHRFGGGMLAFSADSRLLASTGPGGMADVTVWDTASGATANYMVFLRKETFSLDTVALSPSGRYLATAGIDKHVRLFELATKREVLHFTNGFTRSGPLAFHPGGRTLASGGPDGAILIWDVTGGAAAHPSGRLAPDELRRAWDALPSTDAKAAYHAMWTLVVAAEQSLPYARAHLPLGTAPDDKAMSGLIAELDAPQFRVREEAFARLQTLGSLAAPAIQRALRRQLSADVRQRLEEHLRALQRGHESALGAGRVAEMLEQIASPDAERLLSDLAVKLAPKPLGQEAQRSLERLQQRSPHP